MPRKRRLLFLSHATADMELAAHIEEVVRASVPDLDVFRTSRTGQLHAGTGWFAEIERNLRAASAFMILITPQSHDRWWVLFEAGAALRSGKPFVPVLAGDLRPEEVNEPLKFLTLRVLSQPAEAAQALEDLGGRLADPSGFSEKIAQLARTANVKALAQEGWERLEFQGGVYAWAGPVARLKEEHAVAEPQGLTAELQRKGLQVTAGFLNDPIEGSRGYSPLYHIDEWNTRHRVMRSDRQVLWVKPSNA